MVNIETKPNDRSYGLGLSCLDICLVFGFLETTDIPMFCHGDPKARFRSTRMLSGDGSELNEATEVAVAAMTIGPKLGYFNVKQALTKEVRERSGIFCRFLRELGFKPTEGFFESSGLADVTGWDPDKIEDSRLLFWLANSDTEPNCHYKIIFLLCELGVDMNKRLKRLGAGPLHAVLMSPWSSEASAEIVRLLVLLLEYGADPCALTELGTTTECIANVSGWIREFKIALLLCGMDPRAVHEETYRRVEEYYEGMADSSSFDERVLCRPSGEGLSRRRAIRGDRLND